MNSRDDDDDALSRRAPREVHNIKSALGLFGGYIGEGSPIPNEVEKGGRGGCRGAGPEETELFRSWEYLYFICWHVNETGGDADGLGLWGEPGV